VSLCGACCACMQARPGTLPPSEGRDDRATTPNPEAFRRGPPPATPRAQIAGSIRWLSERALGAPWRAHRRGTAQTGMCATICIVAVGASALAPLHSWPHLSGPRGAHAHAHALIGTMSSSASRGFARAARHAFASCGGHQAAAAEAASAARASMSRAAQSSSRSASAMFGGGGNPVTQAAKAVRAMDLAVDRSDPTVATPDGGGKHATVSTMDAWEVRGGER
jgi:hypothetical protein